MIWRVAVAITAALVAWLLALPGPPLPLTPATVEPIEPARMHAVFGQADVDGPALAVSSDGGDSALQVLSGLDIDADSVSVLRYRIADFPSTLELVLLWRTAQQPGDFQSATIPAPGPGRQAFDLGRLPGWEGRVVELGLGQIPTPLQVPPGDEFAPFRIEALALESPALGNTWRRHYDELTATRPWTQRSINSLGREVAEQGGVFPVLPLVAALAAFAVVLLVFLRRRSLPWLFAAAVLTWLLLDLAWQGQLRAQNRLTEASARIAPRIDVELASAAQALREWLMAHRPSARVLLSAPDRVTGYRLIHELLPVNVALLGHGLGRDRQPLPGSVVLVHERSGSMVSVDQLRFGSLRFEEARRAHRIGPWRLYDILGDESDDEGAER